MNYTKHLRPESFTQTEPIPGTVQNSAGGFSYALDDWGRLQRFLVLGTEAGTYYASEKKLTRENAQVVARCVKENFVRAVDTIVDVSVNGRAPKNDAAVFALALVAAYVDPTAQQASATCRQYALSKLNQVCRTGTHLFQFVEAVNTFRGWGQALKKAVARWYTKKTPDDLAYQVTKYAQRNGWSHRDVLRLCHPSSPAHEPVFRFVVHGSTPGVPKERVVERKVGDAKISRTYAPVSHETFPRLLYHVEAVKAATDAAEVARLVREHGLVREVVPTQFLNSPDVWDALLHAGEYGMPLTALVRNLGKMTAIGLVAPLSAAERFVVEKLDNPEALKAARVHPLAILNALLVYGQGHGDKGSLTWKPSALVLAALDRAFYAAFGHVVPAGKRFVLGVDTSGSMGWSKVAGLAMTPYQAATAMAMVVQRTEPWCHLGSFNTDFRSIPITTSDSLDQGLRKMMAAAGGGTDCSQPMVWAAKNKVEADCFVVLTDSETWAGNTHPSVALKKYREQSGIGAKMVVVGMQSNGFTIADPNDSGSLDVVGFDLATPELISSFAGW